MDELMSIGHFARVSGLSVGTLRHYDEVGLLRPADVDGDTGYRRYRPDQLPQARAIRRLRELELSLDQIREVLATGDLELLKEHRARLEAQIWRHQRAAYHLKRLIEGEDDLMAEPKTVDADHRSLGVALYNDTWRLLEKTDRTPEEDDELVHQAHASAYHWLKASECEPKNRARGEWMCSRVYSVLGRAEPALHHAERCLAITEASPENMEDFDLPFAYEALARAHGVAGNTDDAKRYRELARESADRIADAEDKEVVRGDLATL
jgi:DNA-binding transcriptional MerR regulator